MRLDKLIADNTDYSRSDVKKLIKAGLIIVNDQVAKSGNVKIANTDRVTLDGDTVGVSGPRYFMLHKPEGYVCANRDSQHPTVFDLLDEPNKDKLQVCGRLDVDTTGLVLITDDGQWNHRLTSPKRRCPKTYHVVCSHEISDAACEKIRAGILLDGEAKPTQDAQIERPFSNEAILTIYEGRYHQVKRMFAACENRVEDLHRLSIGQITLPEDLPQGEYRSLSPEQVESI